MRRAKQLLLHTSAMTATSLLMRTIALVFQVYVAGKIGAAGIGLFQLVMSVYTLATTVAVSGVRLAATRLIAQQTGRGDDAAIRRATGCAMGYAAFFGMAALLLLFYLAPAAAAWVGDDRIILSLRVLAFALPFVAASGAMGGYFIAMHQSVKMSLVQLSEQFIRIGCTVLALLRLAATAWSTPAAPLLSVCSPRRSFPSWRCCFCCLPPSLAGRAAAAPLCCRLFCALRCRFPSAATHGRHSVPPSTCLSRGGFDFLAAGLRRRWPPMA